MEKVTAFQIGARTYLNNGNGYYYMTINGTNKTRIKKSDFEEAYNEFVEEATREVEESMETEEVLEAAREAQGQEKPKRKPTKRIPKSVGYRKTLGDVEVILTEKQLDFLKHLPDTCFWEDGTKSEVWIDCLCDEIGGQFKGKPMTVGAMISTLCEKGLGYRCKNRVNNRKCTSFGLTELGRLVAEDLGL
jgi:hypothetical protein